MQRGRPRLGSQAQRIRSSQTRLIIRPFNDLRGRIEIGQRQWQLWTAFACVRCTGVPPTVGIAWAARPSACNMDSRGVNPDPRNGKGTKSLRSDDEASVSLPETGLMMWPEHGGSIRVRYEPRTISIRRNRGSDGEMQLPVGTP